MQDIRARHRRVPRIPQRGRSMRVVIDSDAKNEIDDLYAIALALLSPDRFRIEGFVGSNYLNDPDGGLESPRKSAEEIRTVMTHAGLADRYPVVEGGHPMQYPRVPSRSSGVEFIIDRAMDGPSDEPLWVIGLGSATNIASAWLVEPRISERVNVFWHFRTRWPHSCYNFNVFGDAHAARLVFHSDLSFVLFDTGTHLTAPMEETAANLLPHGDLGRYLHEYRHLAPLFADPEKGFFDLGDIAALVEPECAEWEEVPCPEVGWDLTYHFRGTLGSILRCANVDRDRSFALLYDRVRAHASGGRPASADA